MNIRKVFPVEGFRYKIFVSTHFFYVKKTNTTYHPGCRQMDRQERVNRILEDMLRMYVMHQQQKWEEYLPLVEFSYNNGYQESFEDLRMSPFEALYGNLKAAQDRQKVYANKKRTAREFKVGENVPFKVKPKQIFLKLGSCTNLAAKFCGTFEILDIIGLVAYMIALPTSMNMHNVFHVSLLKKYVHDPNHVIDWHLIEVETEGDFQALPVRVLDKKVKILWNRLIELVKIQWTYYGPKDAT
jgi:hypothetical protein